MPVPAASSRWPLCQPVPTPPGQGPKRLPAKQPSPRPTRKFIPDLGQNPSSDPRGKAQIGTRWVACSSVFLFYLSLQHHLAVSGHPLSLLVYQFVSLFHAEQLPIILYLMVLALIQISFALCDQQGRLSSWSSLSRS